MRICLDMRTGAGCGTENLNHAYYCRKCDKPLRFALILHDPKTEIGRYRVVRVIGYGAYGAVYEASKRDEGQTSPLTRFFSRYLLGNAVPDEPAGRVALKETFDASSISSFAREFKVLSGLHHANLPRYIDMFEADGNGYLVMEYVAGQSLHSILDARTDLLPESQVLGYALQLCDVLEYLHSQQPPILHRDIKPANIRLTPEGRIKLVDFGLLKQAGYQTRATIRGLGTPAYAPLEQYGDSQQATNAQSDIYSLGATLYHLLSGQEPLSAPNRLGAESLLPLPPTVSSHVKQAVMKAMSLMPQDRFASMSEFKQALAGIQSAKAAPVVIEEPVQAKIEEKRDVQASLPSIAPPNLPASPKRTSISLNAVPLPSLTPASSQVLERKNDFYSILPDLVEQGMTWRIGRGVPHEVIVLADGSVLVIAGGGAALFDMGSSRPIWEIDCPATCGALSPDGKRLALDHYSEIYLWDLQTGQLLHTLRGHTKAVNSVAFSPTGILASGSWDETVRLWDRQGQQLHVFKGHTERVRSVAFSPTGMLASSSSDLTVRLWDMQKHKLHLLIEQPEPVTNIAFSPSGRIMACASHDDTVRLWDMQGNKLTTLNGHTSTVNSVTFIDEETIASASYDYTVRLWDTRGQELGSLTEHTASVNSVAYESAGILASASDDNTVRLWDLNGYPLHCFSEHSGYVPSVTFTPDGRFLALGAHDDKTVYLLPTVTTSERKQHRLHGLTRGVTSVAASPDSRFLALGSRDETVRLWNLHTLELYELHGHSKLVTCVAISPDGRLLASGGWDNTVCLWDMSGRLLHVLSGHTAWVEGVAFSPDGHLLASASRDQTVRLWDMQGQPLRTLIGHTSWVTSVGFSSTGILASASNDHTIQLWDMQGNKLRSLTGHSRSVKSVAFSAQNMLASASDDKTVRLWDMRGRKLARLSGHSDHVESVAFSPDGQLLVSASEDKTVRLWDVGKQSQQAEDGFRRWQEVRLKREEWERKRSRSFLI